MNNAQQRIHLSEIMGFRCCSAWTWIGKIFISEFQILYEAPLAPFDRKSASPHREPST